MVETKISTIITICVIFISILFPGCLESDREKSKNDQVKDAFIEHFNCLLEGNAEGFISGFDMNFVDLDTGEPVNFDNWSNNVRALFNDQTLMKELDGLSINDLFEMDNLDIWDDKKVRDDGEFDFELTKFTLKDGDFLLFVSPDESGPFLPYGHHAYYRKIDGDWKIIAIESCVGDEWALIT